MLFFFVRYVDDILVAVGSHFNFDAFLAFLSSLHPALKFTFEWDLHSPISFLDVFNIRFHNRLKLKVFPKSAHSNSYLHFFSFHSYFVKLSVARGLFFARP